MCIRDSSSSSSVRGAAGHGLAPGGLQPGRFSEQDSQGGEYPGGGGRGVVEGSAAVDKRGADADEWP
eukprot:1097371-Alexandrium_andersonii.AAC.1